MSIRMSRGILARMSDAGRRTCGTDSAFVCRIGITIGLLDAVGLARLGFGYTSNDLGVFVYEHVMTGSVFGYQIVNTTS
jgi:hypothetical protein